MDENTIVSLPEKRLQKRFAVPEPPQQEPVCPECKCLLAATSHGWVRAYWPPLGIHRNHSEKCHKKYGYCDIPCPLCTGGIEAKRSAQLINELFGDAHIPWYARDWRFETLPEDRDGDVLDEVKDFVRYCLAGTAQKRGLYLVGKNGLYKTSMAISALQYVLRKGHAGCFITTAEFFDIAKDALAATRRIQDGGAADFQERYEASRGAKLHRLVKSVEWLVLDDLGVECGSKYEIRELYLIIEARRSQGLYTLFTSNCDAKSLYHHWRHPKEGVYEDSHRVIDRIGEMCFVIPVTGTNKRLQVKGG